MTYREKRQNFALTSEKFDWADTEPEEFFRNPKNSQRREERKIKNE